MGILQARILEWVAMPSSRGSSQPSDRTQISHIVGGFFLPTKPPGKPKNTGLGSLSLLQWIFPTQESNWSLLHCRRILYQLSYQGSPKASRLLFKKKKKKKRPLDYSSKPLLVIYSVTFNKMTLSWYTSLTTSILLKFNTRPRTLSWGIFPDPNCGVIPLAPKITYA